MQIRTKFRRLLVSRKGTTSIEYGLIITFLGLALLPALASTSDGVASIYETIKELWVYYQF